MDFIELLFSEGKKYCLVIIDMFLNGLNLFLPQNRTQILWPKHWCERSWGIPCKIPSNNGTSFVSAAWKQVSEYFGIHLKQHCAHHPARGGAVKRENGTLKNKLSKCCAKTCLGWTKVLHIAHMQMCMREKPKFNLSPFEILNWACKHTVSRNCLV